MARALRTVRTAQRGGQGRPGGRACGVCVCAAPAAAPGRRFVAFARWLSPNAFLGRGVSCHWKQIFFFLITLRLSVTAFQTHSGLYVWTPSPAPRFSSRFLRIFCLGHHVIWKRSRFSPSAGRGSAEPRAWTSPPCCWPREGTLGVTAVSGAVSLCPVFLSFYHKYGVVPSYFSASINKQSCFSLLSSVRGESAVIRFWPGGHTRSRRAE